MVWQRRASWSLSTRFGRRRLFEWRRRLCLWKDTWLCWTDSARAAMATPPSSLGVVTYHAENSHIFHAACQLLATGSSRGEPAWHMRWGRGDVVGSPVTLHPQVALSRAQRSARSHLRRDRHYQKVSSVSFGSPAQASHSVTTTTMRQQALHSVSSSRVAIAAGTARATSASSTTVRYSFAGASRT